MERVKGLVLLFFLFLDQRINHFSSSEDCKLMNVFVLHECAISFVQFILAKSQTIVPAFQLKHLNGRSGPVV